MRKKWLPILILLLLAHAVCWAHLEQMPVVIDTDVALDDARSLVLMLSSEHLQVRAVVSSDGSSSPEIGCVSIHRILRILDKGEIAVGRGSSLDAPAPPWRDIAESISTLEVPSPGRQDLPGASTGAGAPATPAGAPAGDGACSLDAVSVIVKTLSESDQSVGYVCLGPLTNLAAVLRTAPSLKDRIRTVFYYGTPPGDPTPDWNTRRDPSAAEFVFSSGLPIYAFASADKGPLQFDMELYQAIERIDSPAARVIVALHQSDKVRRLLAQDHFQAWDETVALFLDDPDLATFARTDAGSSTFRLTRWDGQAARAHYLTLLEQAGGYQLEAREPVVLVAYPSRPEQFQSDLRPLVGKIIAVHGIEEWKAVVLTNELHRHLGIYSILGAKMGILAREILRASLDELTVASHAGLKPPLSCFNDGLQVATGASLGRGNISVAADEPPAPEAVFEAHGRKLRLSLKQDARERIKADIKRAIELYGNLTPEYFKEVRRLSFAYWADMKRDEIFDRQELAP